MAHNWVNCGSAAGESYSELRLDPCHLSPSPQSVCYRGRQSGRCFTAFLTERSVFIQKHDADYAAGKIMPRFSAAADKAARQKRGKVLKIVTPQQFRGIAACRISAGGAAPREENIFCLILLHDEADYSVPLLISAGKYDVLMDWRLWADSYNLPMLIGEGGRFRAPCGAQGQKLFITGGKMRQTPRAFSLRCRGLSLSTRLVLANQIMLG